MATPAVSDERLLQRLQAIAEPTRLGIIRQLTTGERCVCDLQGDMEAAQSRLSFHLKKLKDAGVLSDRRDGRWVYYSLVPEALEEMRAFLGDCCVAGECAPAGVFTSQSSVSGDEGAAAWAC